MQRSNVIGLVVAGLVIAGAQGVQAWSSWHREMSNPGLQFGGSGTLISVTLASGQVYYGNLVESGSTLLKLENVYYVQSAVNPNNSQADNRLVNRHKADWHGPQWMAIPVEKILTVEGVAPGSRLAQLIEQDKKAAASP